jgi:hypothetical protein
MPLYLDEIWLNVSTREAALRAYSAFQGLAAVGVYPDGVRLVAGPWFSNEEAKVILVVDISDHARTFTPFAGAVIGGLILRRRLEPIVEAAGVDELLAALPA